MLYYFANVSVFLEFDPAFPANLFIELSCVGACRLVVTVRCPGYRAIAIMIIPIMTIATS